jgi:crotonobetainyl-CoA:carnitine CoA-transferase CaiB-like acyl-CoA transferase
MLGQPELPHTPHFATAEQRAQHMPEFVQQVYAWCATRTYEEAAQALETYQVPYSLVMSMADIFAEPHYKARDMIIEVPEPTVGPLPQPGVVPKLSRTPGRVTHAGPLMGTHTEAILSDLLGLSTVEIAALRQEGVI